MPEYRIYQLDDKGQPSQQPSGVGIWNDDAEAKTNALLLLDGHAIEIRCGERKVATIQGR